MKDKLILLMDRDADCGAVVLEIAARTGCGVRLSWDGRDALATLRREFERIRCIVIDLDPVTSGLAFLKAIQPLRHLPPVIVLTSLEPGQMEAVTASHGALRCFGKPAPVDQLEVTVKQILESRPHRVISSGPEEGDGNPGPPDSPMVHCLL